jgi:hypothetical protein
MKGRQPRAAGCDTMQRHELEEWLCDDSDAALTPTEMAILLGDQLDPFDPSVARSLRFVGAVLRDIFADDALVRDWLYRPRAELDGSHAVDMLFGEGSDQVASLVVDEWNARLREGELAVNGC